MDIKETEDDVHFVTDYERECFDSAMIYLEDPALEDALYLLMDAGMNADEIQMAARIVVAIETGEF